MFLRQISNKFLLLGFFCLATCLLPSIALADLDVSPKGELIGRYDDNITRQKDNEIGDFSTKLLGGVAVELLEKTYDLRLDVDLGYQFFAKENEYDNFSQYATFQGNAEFANNGGFKILDSYSHTEEPQSFEAIFNRPAGRFSTHHNYLSTEYKQLISRQLSGGLKYINDMYLNEDTSDTYFNEITGEISYAIDSATEIGPLYSYKRMDFEPGNSAFINEIALKFRRYLSEQMYVDLVAGPDFIHDFDDDNYSRPAIRAFLTTDIDKNTQTVFSVSKEYTVTPYSEELFSGWRFSSNLSKELSERLVGFFNMFYTTGRFVTSDVDDNFFGATLGVNYDLTKNAKLILNYTFSRDDHEVSQNSYTRNVVSLGVKVEL